MSYNHKVLGARPGTLTSAILAIATLSLAIDEVARNQSATHFSWPSATGVGALASLALVLSTAWLTLDTRLGRHTRAWAKASFALALALPLAWLATINVVRGKITALPDGPMPHGLGDRMNADVAQMQIGSVIVTIGILVCIGMAQRRRGGI